MWIILGILIAGIITGFIIRGRVNEKIFDLLLKISIYALLFLLGIGIGSNKKLMDNLGTISLHALIITLGAVSGSLIAAKILFEYWNKHNKK